MPSGISGQIHEIPYGINTILKETYEILYYRETSEKERERQIMLLWHYGVVFGTVPGARQLSLDL